MQMDCPKCWGKSKTCVRCKGAGKVADEQLSPHFKLSEMLKTLKGRELGLDNDPPVEVIANLRRLCNEALEPIRTKVGPLQVNSGYRSDAVNKAVGGSTTSAHSFGLAADLHPPKGCKALMNAIIASGVKLDQLIFEHSWVHVGLLNPRTMKQRGDVLSMFKVNGETKYPPYDPNDPRIA